MPVTRGSGNPDWTSDEVILALDLLYRHRVPIDRKHPDVLELSKLLRSARIYPAEARKDNFRNADGVALKLQNLLSALEPGRGLSSSKTDREVVKDFPRSRSVELAAIARAIRRELATGQPLSEVSDDEVFMEGRVVTAAHRQRDQRLRARLLSKRSDDRLICEICEFAPPNLERVFRESFFEAHHVTPLAQASGLKSTRVADMALLCAGCHRFLHKLISKQKRWIDISEARQTLKPPT